MLGCDKTITIYHKTFDDAEREDAWHSVVVKGCSWFRKRQSSVNDGKVSSGDLFIVRIPLTSAPEEIVFAKGDYVLLGDVVFDNPKPSQLLSNRDDIFVVESYSVNELGGQHIKHIRISGS